MKVQYLTHLPQAKILLWWIKPFMPKVGFWTIERKTQQNYGTTDDKNTNERSTKIWQNFSKNIL